MIKQFFDIVSRYFRPYKMYIVWSIVLNFVAQWLNVFSFVVLIPILNILFKIDQNVYTYQEWTWKSLNKDLIVNNAYAWVQEMIDSGAVYRPQPWQPRQALRYLKSFLGMSIRLFKIKFVNCFVEGIRSDYESMGYGAALNGILKGFPYLRAWDFRMDWCHNRELHAQGEIHARTNLCRVFSLALAMFVYAGILFLLFWRRRSHVLKTGELPELGFIRKKIVGWMVED